MFSILSLVFCYVCTDKLNEGPKVLYNIVKVVTKNDLKKSQFSEALDFKREINETKNKFVYHHIGIYGFTSEALMRYVNLKRSKLELERNLEQMRALENDMKIHVGYVKSNPLSIDTEEDFLEVKKVMEI